MPTRLLIVALDDESHLPEQTHVLLSQRLVLVAVAETKATEIAFWDCPAIARSFNLNCQTGMPELTDHATSILGQPAWVEFQASPWMEILVPNKSMTAYITTRLVARSSADLASLQEAGLSKAVGKRLLEHMPLQNLQNHARRVSQDLDTARTLRSLTEIFRRRKDVEAVLLARPLTAVAVRAHRVTEMI
jgi:hypothetical protein